MKFNLPKILREVAQIIVHQLLLKFDLYILKYRSIVSFCTS